MTPDYDLEFDITPTGPAIDNWMNIIHFTSNKIIWIGIKLPRFQKRSKKFTQ
jgi:hypothetical protein